jgi:hypothetical protein
MAVRKREELSAGLERAKQRFRAWRKTRKVGARIPEPLWALAVKQAKTHGVSAAASVLGLEYYALKKRLESASVEPPATGGGFVEVTPLSPMPSGGECLIEFENATGDNVRVHLKGCPPPDLIALGRSFWNHQ